MRQPGLGAKTKKMKRWLLEFYVNRANKMISDEARALELLAQKMDELEKRVAKLEAHQPVVTWSAGTYADTSNQVGADDQAGQ